MVTSSSHGLFSITKIYTNLFHNRPPAKSSDHHWQLFITDALTGGHGEDGTGSSCDFLQGWMVKKRDLCCVIPKKLKKAQAFGCCAADFGLGK